MSVAACPGCMVGDAATVAAPERVTHQLVVPGIHCAGCIRGIETALAGVPEIAGARVNLTAKRVAIAATPGADPTPWIAVLARAGYEAFESDEAQTRAGDDMILHLGVAGFAMMNVMLLSVAVWSGAADSTRDFLHWVAAAIALPATAFSAQPFFRSAAQALKGGRLNMDVPISLAILLACGMSLYEVIHGGAHAWFDAALALTFFLLIGRVLDQRLRRAARSAADNLSALEPSRALRLEDGARISRPLREIAVGDLLWLAAGARVPVDAVLAETGAQIDASFLTGESDPVQRPVGAAVYAGEIMLTGPVTLRATAVGEDTKLRRVAQLVAMAEGARGMFRGLADRAASVYTPAVHIISAVAFLGWLWATGDVRMALNVAIATLIITCPCALGLAVPAAAVSATSRLYKAGLLVTSETALERIAGVDTVVFDKTGTLTERVLDVPALMPEGYLPVLRSLAVASDHPLSRGLARRLKDAGEAPLRDVHEIAGNGVFATWGDTPVRLSRGEEAETGTVFCCGDVCFALPSVERPLPHAAEAVAALEALGLRTVMLTGDKRAAAQRVGSELGISDLRAEVAPEEKAQVVGDLQAQGAHVLMIGDGLNDTAALAAAQASIAPGAALDASRNAADVILVSGDLRALALTVRTARTARWRILQNFGLAAGYNAIAVPIAVLGFATPLAAAIAMSTSSITVILNSIRRQRA
ncbi:MAG: heavy metal translocating P-type ATPase [Pseudomonadota bacterium]